MKKVLYILGELEDDDAEWLKKVGVSRLLSTGEVLIHEGRPIESLFFVTQGSFAVTAGDASESVATVGTGEVLGEISFVDRRPPTATVTAAEESGVLAIPKDVLTAKLEDDPGFAVRFYRAVALFLADRLRTTMRHVAGEAQDDELNLYELEAFSRAGARFEGILRHIQGV